MLKQEIIFLIFLHVLFDFVHEHRINTLFHGVQDSKHAIKLRNLDEFHGVVRQAGQYKNAFILRRRISYVEGFPTGDPEIVFKFRHPDMEAATRLDVRPKIAGKYRIKFKAEALPLKDRPGGVRILYSHNCQFGLSQTGDGDQTSMATIGRVFPALTALKTSDEERISVVNNGIVEEVLLPLGTLDFGGGVLAKCDVSLWRTRGEHKPLVGEFAFQAKFAKREEISAGTRKLAAKF